MGSQSTQLPDAVIIIGNLAFIAVSVAMLWLVQSRFVKLIIGMWVALLVVGLMWFLRDRISQSQVRFFQYENVNGHVKASARDLSPHEIESLQAKGLLPPPEIMNPWQSRASSPDQSVENTPQSWDEGQ